MSYQHSKSRENLSSLSGTGILLDSFLKGEFYFKFFKECCQYTTNGRRNFLNLINSRNDNTLTRIQIKSLIFCFI